MEARRGPAPELVFKDPADVFCPGSRDPFSAAVYVHKAKGNNSYLRILRGGVG